MKFLPRLAVCLAALPLMAGTTCIDEKDLPLPQLPQVTQSGTNTIGFVLDGGRIWRDYGTHCAGVACDSNKVRVMGADARRGMFTIRAGYTTKQHNEQIWLDLVAIKQPGAYGYGNYNTKRQGVSVYFTDYYAGPQSTAVNYANRPNSFTAIITRLDTVARIISGTFEGKLVDVGDSTRNRTITDGRFDVRYRF